MSLREFLWIHLYKNEIPPESLTAKEVVVALIIACIFFGLWWLIRRGFFFYVQRASAARGTALLFSISLSIAWLIGSLEPFGYSSFIVMIMVLAISAVISFIYLYIKRR